MAIDFDAIVLTPLAGIFGEPVTWQPAGGVAVATTAIFDAAFRQTKWTGEQEILATRPRLGCRVADLGGVPAEGDAFTVRGLAYRVAEPPLVDGIGHVEIFLHGPL